VFAELVLLPKPFPDSDDADDNSSPDGVAAAPCPKPAAAPSGDAVACEVGVPKESSRGHSQAAAINSGKAVRSFRLKGFLLDLLPPSLAMPSALQIGASPAVSSP